MAEIEVRMLGTIAVAIDASVIDLRGPRQRRLLAMMALRAGEPVAVGSIIDAVWPDGEHLPDAPRETLHTYISRLRRDLGSAAVVSSRGGGYALDIDPNCVDVIRFERLVTRSATVASSEQPAVLEQALRLWHGPPFSGFEHEEWARPHTARLVEMRAQAIDDLATARISLAQHDAAIPLLSGAVEESPLRERTHRLLMEALHRSGRTAEALRVGHAFRKRLATDIGLSPGPELVALEQAIAASDGSAFSPDSPGLLHGYELHERIGEGAFAVVYRATQPALGRTVAIKQIRAELANRPEFIRRFESEAHLVARLEHPHIVALHDFWREPGSAYLVMRWLRGGSLEALLRHGPMDLDRVLTMASELGSALAAAHRAGVIHRDVKPANVLLDEDGRSYLGDFGIARTIEISHQPADSLSIGSPAYASPEQLRREQIGPSADVFSLAMVVYEALTAQLPFADARNQAELLRRQLNDPIPAVRSRRPELPIAIDLVLAKATAKRSNDRYQTAAEFVAALTESVVGSSAPNRDRDREGAMTVVPRGTDANPYKGLRAFDEADAADFFGRERLVDALVSHLADSAAASRLLALVGPSGSGKSSLVRAGLIPAVRRGAVRGSSDWFVTTMVPGMSPFGEFVRAMHRIAAEVHPELGSVVRSGPRGLVRATQQVLRSEGAQLLLVIDQFEEMFTLVADDERVEFLAALAESITTIGSPIRVVATLRADFFGEPLRYPTVARLFADSTIAITPLAPDELETVIVTPARRCGVHFEPGLIAELIADVGGQPGALPLLQYALTELYERRVSDMMTIDEYRSLGGLAGAIAGRAEELYTAAAVEAQDATRRLMRRLVSLGEGSEDTRRRVRRLELPSNDATSDVIEAFGKARLLSFDRDPADRGQTIEVAHEALIRQWPRLREWVGEDRAGLRAHRLLTTAANSWDDNGRDEGELFRGGRLITTEDWVTGHAAELNDTERRFFDASVAARDDENAAEREQHRQRIRQNVRLRRLAIAATVAAVTALLVGGLALNQRARAADRAADATKSAYDAETGRIGALAAQIVRTDRRVGLLLAAEAYRREPGPATLGTLQRVLTQTGGLLGYFGGEQRYEAVVWVDDRRVAAARAEALDIFEIDGTATETFPLASVKHLAVDAGRGLLAAGTDDTVTVIDLTTGEIVRTHKLLVQLQALKFAEDGVLGIGSRSGSLDVIDPRTGANLLSLAAAHPETTLSDLPEHVHSDAVIEQLPHVPTTARRGTVDVVFDPNGEWVATTGFGFLRIWNRSTGALLSEALLTRETSDGTLITSGYSVDYSLVGDRVGLTVADPTTMWEFDPRSGALLSMIDHSERAAFLFGGTVGTAVEIRAGTAVAGFNEFSARTRSFGDGAASRIDHGLGEVVDIALGPKCDDRHGCTAAAFAGEGGVAVVSMVGDGLIADALPISREGGEATVSADGLTVATMGTTHPLQLNRWNGSDWAELALEAGRPYFVYMSERADTAVVAARDGFEIIDPRTGTTRARLEDWDPSAGWIAFNPDSTEFAILAADGLIHLRSAADGALIRAIDDFVNVRSLVFANSISSVMSFSPDGRTLYVTDWQGTLGTIELVSGDVTRTEVGGVMAVSSDPNGETLYSSQSDGSLIERDISTMQPTGRKLLASESELGETVVIFAADGRLMFIIGNERVQIWDSISGQPIGDVFPSDDHWSSAYAGNGIVTGIGDHPVIWNADVDSWPDIACRAAGRNLTLAEWEQYGPDGESYAPTCTRYSPLGGTDPTIDPMTEPTTEP